MRYAAARYPPVLRSQRLARTVKTSLSTCTLCAPAEEEKKEDGSFPYAADSVMRSASR